MRKRLAKKKMKQVAELAAQWYVDHIEEMRDNARMACVSYGGQIIKTGGNK